MLIGWSWRNCGLLVAGVLIVRLLSAPTALSAELFGPRSRELKDGFAGALEGVANENDHLGQALAVGDFDCDGEDDLAATDFASGFDLEVGAVHVLYFGAHGVPLPEQVLQDFVWPTGTPDDEFFDRFGAALAAGDFDGDGCDDLAIGIPGEDIGEPPNEAVDAGMVAALYGSVIGLRGVEGSPPAYRFQAGELGSPFASGVGFGTALAAGDFDGDGFDDLAIGAPLGTTTLSQISESGFVGVLYGSENQGLRFQFNQVFEQDSEGSDGEMQDEPEAGDHFGQSLAAGDFNGDQRADLAIGVPGESIAGVDDAGIVQVLYGFPLDGFVKGLRLTNNQAWNESNIDTGGLLELADRFGSVLAAGDLTEDGVDDLAIGAPEEDVDGFINAGAVSLLFGQAGVGLHPANSALYDQSDLADGEATGHHDNFGNALAIGDFVELISISANDLAIGVVGEDVLSADGTTVVSNAGGVSIVPAELGLLPSEAVFWAQGYRGSVGAESLSVGNDYGHALAAGDLDGDGHDDLAIGAIRVDGRFSEFSVAIDSGAVYVLFGALFADGFASGDTARWSAEEP